jgi:hypothetical protein
VWSGKVGPLNWERETVTPASLPCGRPEILPLGLCPTCYTLKRQDEEYFGGLREAVLERDGYRARGTS